MTREAQILLGIDTCGPSGTVALARLDGEALIVLGQTELPGKTYSARLIPAIRELLASHQICAADLAAIVVTSGPGSFTGIRVGLSTAKGLAEVHQTPILAVSRLAVLAHAAGTRAAALDASRGEFYLGEFGAGRQESLVPRERLLEDAAPLGDDLAVCEASVFGIVLHARSIPPSTAVQAIEFALQRFRAGQFDDPMTLDGNYLRRSDAEIFAKGATRPAISIRTLEPADLDAVAAIAHACPEAPRWTAKDYAAFVRLSAPATPPGRTRAAFVAVAGRGIFGFAAASLVLDGQENRCELESMAVRVDDRRQGTGSALLRAVLDWAATHGARRLGLEVRASNAAAIRFYERHGLQPEGRRSRYYADPEEDALLLGITLSAEAFSTIKGS